MKKLTGIIRKISDGQVFVLGLIIVGLSFIPYLILGTDSIVPYHDQLDGEILAYIYQAKYLFSGSEVIPEFLNGASKMSLVAPAPLAVILFKVFPPFVAYMLMQMVCQLVSYVGMYRLVRVFSDRSFIAFVTALLFTYIPFLPVYGLSQYGTPLLLYCLISLYKRRNVVWCYTYIVLFSLMSSLVLSGFAWLGVWLLGLIYLLLSCKIRAHKEMFIGFGAMLSVYMLSNLSLLGQVLGVSDSFVSHKREYVLNATDFWSTLLRYFKENNAHSTDYHIWILYLTIFAVIMLWLAPKDVWSQRLICLRNVMPGILGFIFVMCVAAAWWDSSYGVQVRNHLGTLGAFQLNRVLWMVSALWYLELALCLEAFAILKGWLCKVGYVAAIPVLAMVSFSILKNSMIKPCLQEILLKDYETISYSDYLALGVMEQVEDCIRKTEGLEIDEYKVASLGIDPAAALYHGFYCVDGYSNNYDIEYKHQFREVIAPELERNEWLKSYFDTWGNRCYLFFAEIPGYYNIESGSFWFNDLQLNTTALKALGCDYILSAAYIVNSEENNLEMLSDGSLFTDDSYYQIYIYKIKNG